VKRALLLLLLCGEAHADPFDSFGFGGRAMGMAGAMTAEGRGAQAIPSNPAGAALAENPEFVIGWGYQHLGLSVNGDDARVLDAHGADLGIDVPFHFGGVTAAFGVALRLPDQFIARIQLIPATEPHFVLLDNDVSRIVVEPVVALRPWPWLAIGGGASILADAAGNGIGFDVGVVAGQPQGDGAVDVTLPTRVAPLFGALITPTPRVRLGVSYRGELDLALRLAILAKVNVAGVVTGDALIDVRALNYFTPRRVSFGAAFDVTDELTLTAEVAWLEYSAFHGGAPDVRILIALGITPPLVDTLFPPDDFHDIVVPRAGVEYRTHLGRTDLALRAGYAYEPSPVPSQVGLTSFADNDTHVLALGAGLKLRAFQPILTRPLTFDLGLQWHHLRDKLTVKDQMTFPGEAFSSGGDILGATGTMTVEF
jgi:long-chain fatty acid transport protein